MKNIDTNTISRLLTFFRAPKKQNNELLSIESEYERMAEEATDRIPDQ